MDLRGLAAKMLGFGWVFVLCLLFAWFVLCFFFVWFFSFRCCIWELYFLLGLCFDVNFAFFFGVCLGVCLVCLLLCLVYVKMCFSF